MKKFSGQRNLKELRKECRQRKWRLREKQYRQGSDYVSFDFRIEARKDYWITGYVFVSMVNGRFFGEVEGHPFSSDSDKYDNDEWFNKLLEVVYKDPIEAETAALS